MIYHNRLFILEDMPKNSICAEVGVFEGTFSQYIIDLTEPKELHLIDSWKMGESWDAFNINKMNFKCDYHIHKKKFEHTNFPDEYFDWIYLDNGHKLLESYFQLKLAYKKVKKGGWIIGDDYDSEKNRSFPHQEQTLAVNMFIINKNFNIEWIPVGGWQFKIRKL